jgi:hypothetical protein
LTHIAGIDPNVADIVFKDRRHLDVFVDEPSEHFLGVSPPIQIEYDGDHRLFAAKNRELPCQPGGTFRGAPNLVDIFSQQTVHARISSD